MTHPDWMDLVAARVTSDPPQWWTDWAPPADVERRSAVLMLFGPRSGVPSGAIGEPHDRGHAGEIDVLLTERSAGLRAHPGQVSFPGGRIDPEDRGPIEAALRETAEETGADPAGIEVVCALPDLHLSFSGNGVTPVLAWWRAPGPVGVVDPAEVARVERVAVSELVDPANRFTVVHPNGYAAPGFAAGGLFVWGFTAMLLHELLELAGLARPWDRSVRRRLPEHNGTPSARSTHERLRGRS